LIKEGKIKKEKPLPEIKPEEIPFKIPSSWKWVRMGEIGYTSVGLTYSPKDISSDGIPVIRSSNIQNDKIYWGDLVRVSKDIPEKLILKNGDIVICARNGSHRLVGKSVQMKDMQEKVTFGAFMAYYRSICNDYVIYFINSKQFRKVLGDVNTTTINQITQNSLKEAILPLPPFREQKRIVKKLQGIMNYIDGCNLKLNQMKELSTKINETVLN
jgi:type I restriction enzyme S subunit